MPKEIIHDVRVGKVVTDMPSGLRVTLDGNSAHVGWTKGREHVEVGVIPPGDHDGPDRPGWFVSLDRVGINRMIRALRRARDDAFGVDA